MTTAGKQRLNKGHENILPYMWKKGQSGNPAGRPKGKTMKEYARELLECQTEEERQAFLNGIPKIDIWKMVDGNPQNTLAAEVKVRNISDVLNELEDVNKITRQTMENEQLIQDTGQAEANDTIPAKPSTTGLSPAQMVTEHYIEEPPTGLHD